MLKYFKEVNAQKQIDKLAQKYKNKKIIIYGAGSYFDTLNENFDLSKLNIIGICDKKFVFSKESNTSKYKALQPKEIKNLDCDLILITLFDDTEIINFLKYKLLINTPNENIKILPLINPTFLYILKLFLLEK